MARRAARRAARRSSPSRPIVGGAVLKGPTAAFMEWAGLSLDGAGVARGLRRRARRRRRRRRRSTALPSLQADTRMDDAEGRARAWPRTVLDFAEGAAMRTCAVLPVKRFDDAKQRLGKTLSSGTRRALAEAMVTDVLDRAAPREAHRRRRRGHRRGRRAEPRPRATTPSTSTTTTAATPPPRAPASRWALERGFERVLLVPGDCPALDPAEVDALLGAARRGPGDRVVPDRHGTGTNALLLSAARRRSRPSFGPGQPRAPRGRRARGRRRLRGRRGRLARARRRHRRGPRRRCATRSPPAPAAPRTRAASLARLGALVSDGRRAARWRACPRSRRATTSPRCWRRAAGGDLRAGDVLVVAHKVVSKAEGALRELADVEPGDRAPRARRARTARTRATCRSCSTSPPRSCAPSAAC